MKEIETYALIYQDNSTKSVVWVGADKEDALHILLGVQNLGGYIMQVWKNGQIIAQHTKVKQNLEFDEG